MNLSAPRIATLLLAAMFVAVGCEEETPDTTASNPTPEVAAVDTVAGQAQATAPAPATTVPTVQVEQFDDLHDLMEEVDDQYLFLRRNIEDGEQAALLERARILLALLEQGKALTPGQVTDATEAEREPLQAAYDTHMADAVTQTQGLIAALESDDREAARAALRRVHNAEEEGHEALDVDDH